MSTRGDGGKLVVGHVDGPFKGLGVRGARSSRVLAAATRAWHLLDKDDSIQYMNIVGYPEDYTCKVAVKVWDGMLPN